MMRWKGYLLACILGQLAGFAFWFTFQRSPDPLIDTRPQVVRDSVEVIRAVERLRVDTLVRWLPRASADTMAAILRDRARRPVVMLGDTVRLESDSVETDSVCLSAGDARGTILHKVADSVRIDSLHQEIAIMRSERDSMATGCLPRTPWSAAGLGFAAGLAVCAVLR